MAQISFKFLLETITCTKVNQTQNSKLNSTHSEKKKNEKSMILSFPHFRISLIPPIFLFKRDIHEEMLSKAFRQYPEISFNTYIIRLRT